MGNGSESREQQRYTYVNMVGNRVLVDYQGVFCCSLGVGVEANIAAAGGLPVANLVKQGTLGTRRACVGLAQERGRRGSRKQNAGTHAVARHVRLFESWPDVQLLRILDQIR